MLKDVSLEDPTGSAGEVPTAALMAKQARLQGLIVGSRREQQDFVRALDASGIRPVVDRRFPLVCGSAWKRDPGSGVIGVEKGPLIPVV